MACKLCKCSNILSVIEIEMETYADRQKKRHRSEAIVVVLLLLGAGLGIVGFVFWNDETGTLPIERLARNTVEAPVETVPSNSSNALSQAATTLTAVNDAVGLRPGASAIEPEFDLVRVDETGATIIAGRAEPYKMVKVMSQNVVLEQVKASGDGTFVAMLDLPQDGVARSLELVTETDSGEIKASEKFLIMPITEDATAAPGIVSASQDGIEIVQDVQLPELVELVPPVLTSNDDLPQSIAIDTPVDTGTEQISLIEQVAALPSTPDMPLAPQTDPQLAQPQEVASLSLDTISYSETGDVVLAGRGRGDGSVRVYVDNKPVQLGAIKDGKWRLSLPNVDEGIYTVRVDQLTNEGQVAARVESPFKREIPDGDALGAEITVQPGFTLWQLAERKYGSGAKYVQIFDANRGQIKDPNLIYPGQIFDLPETLEPEN